MPRGVYPRKQKQLTYKNLRDLKRELEHAKGRALLWEADAGRLNREKAELKVQLEKKVSRDEVKSRLVNAVGQTLEAVARIVGEVGPL